MTPAINDTWRIRGSLRPPFTLIAFLPGGDFAIGRDGIITGRTSPAALLALGERIERTP